MLMIFTLEVRRSRSASGTAFHNPRNPTMSLAPLFDAVPQIPIPAFAAMAAFALDIAGLFTFMPGRILHAVVFGS
jgi:hypothetical protein